MLTPKDVDEQRFPLVQFRKGYDIGSVDDFLDVLSADFAALYEENATLKAKMKVLVQYISDQSRHIRDLELAAADSKEEAEPVQPVLTILPAAQEAEEDETPAVEEAAVEEADSSDEAEPVGV